MNIVNNYEWSTHVPLNKILVEEIKPELIVELGTGLYSTPIFLQSQAKKLFFIDNDTEWLNEIKNKNKFDERCSVIHHDLGNEIHLTTFLKELSEEKKNEIFNYYKKLEDEIKKIELFPKMLFVDHYTCARALSINALYSSFDIIVYHDCQPKGIRWYEYYFEKNLHLNYDSYFLTSPTSWTGCFIKKSLQIKSNLCLSIDKHIIEYCNDNDLVKSQMVLEKK